MGADIGRSGGGSRLEQRPKRTGVANAILIKAQIVEEQDEGPPRVPQQSEKPRQAGQFVDRALQQGDVLPLGLELADHGGDDRRLARPPRSEEHTSELQSLMRISYAVFCLNKKNKANTRR